MLKQTGGGYIPRGGKPPLSFGFADPVLLHLAKTAKKPTFSGKQSDWYQFVADWETFWAKGTTGREMSDEVKLATFESCHDEVSRQELALLRKMKAKVSYKKFFAKLEANFGKKTSNFGGKNVVRPKPWNRSNVVGTMARVCRQVSILSG